MHTPTGCSNPGAAPNIPGLSRACWYLLCQLLKANGPLLGGGPIDPFPDMGVPGVGLGEGKAGSDGGECSELREMQHPQH